MQYSNTDHIRKRLKVGVHGHCTTEEGRVLAKKYLGGIAPGKGLVKNAKQVRALATINNLAQDYIEHHGQKKRAKSLKEDQNLLNNLIWVRS